MKKRKINKKEEINKDKIKKLIKSLPDNNEWTLSDEREFLENLYVGRFNFFLVVFSLFITAGFANGFKEFKYLVFYFGAILLVMFWITLLRAYIKFNNIMKIIFSKEGHTINLLQQILKLKGFKSYLIISNWMGIYIPIMCITFLLAIGILIHIGIIK